MEVSKTQFTYSAANLADWKSLMRTIYDQVSVSSGVERTGCWHEHKSLRKHGINFISNPIDKLDHRCAGKIFNFNFVVIVVVKKQGLN